MLYRRSKTGPYWCRFTDRRGREIRRSTGTTDRKLAEQYEAKLKRDLWGQAELGERRQRTWKEAVVKWNAEKEHKASVEDDQCILRWLDPYLAELTLDQINRELIDTIQTARKAEGVSNATVNRTMALLRAILRCAEVDWEWMTRAPKVRMLPEPKRRVRWLTETEADRLIAELPEHLADIVRFALATGLREGNILSLEWSQVDLTRRTAWIHPDQAKARRAIPVPLNKDAVIALRRQVGKHATRVFTYNGSPIAKAGTAAWKKALARAGITDFRFHDLRHTWASWMVQAGTPLNVLQEMGGWETPAMVNRYAHLSSEHLAEYAERISSDLHTVDAGKCAGTIGGTGKKNRH
jgi:integrase